MRQGLLQRPETLGTHVLVPEFENDGDQIIVRVSPGFEGCQRYYVPEYAMVRDF